MTVEAFTYTGAYETWDVPSGVHRITVDMAGGAGGSESGDRARGGRVQCEIAVDPGDTLYVYVARQAASAAEGGSPSIAFYRGGEGQASTGRSVGGGGLSAVVLNGAIGAGTILAVAGGAGGRSGSPSFAAGGHGGGLVGQAGTDTGSVTGGGGGTQSAGGAAGTGGGGTGHVAATAGENRGRHSGGVRGQRTAFARNGGSGGGGWYGGGGGEAQVGASGDPRSGGGGGSSYTHPSLATAVTHTQGYQDGNGYVTLTYRANHGWKVGSL